LTSSNWFRDTQNSIRKTTGNPSAEVLPISLYSDGVEVGPNRSVVSVLGTCGLYSDELQRKHLAKFCLGYIKELDNVPLSTIERHLQTYAGYTITGASDALKEFKATISQTFWAALTTSIKAHHQNGIKMRVLCHEKVHEMYPVLAFVIGDEPAQHAVTSVKQNNTKRPCNQCTYCPADRIEYSEDAFPFRDHDEMKELCPIASEGYLRLQDHKLTQSLASKKVRKQRSAEILSEEETDAIIRLKSLSVHPRVNPFHDVPMGFNNNIYCTPNDPFHVYCAGLMKAAVGWILLIVTTIGTLDERLRGASAILDNRLDTFPYCPVLPHVPNTYFRNGLTYCVDGKSKREKQNATGSLGGFRSSHYITALIHLYLAIGYNGDILPNDNEFKHGDIEYGNPTAKVFNSILALLDVYFQCKQNYFSDRQIKKLELDMRSSNAHFHVLWELKQAIIGAPRKDVLAMKKPHMQLHIPRAIEYWGCPSKTNTERFEAAHNPLTKQVYDVTSKNKDTTVSEMTIVGVSKTLAEHINHASCIAEQGMDYLLGLRPLVNDNLLYTCANNIKKWRLDYAIGSFSLLDDYLPITSRPKFWTATHRKNNTSLKSKKTLVSLLPTLITKDSFCKIVMNWFLEMNLMSKLEDGRNQVSLIGGLTIEGNDESGIEKVHIYATANFKSDKQTTASRRPKERYDFVEIQMCEGESQLAQVLAFLEITESGKRTKYIAVVAYLVPEILDENFAAKKMKNDSIPYLKKKHASPFFRRYQYAYLNTSTLQIEVIKAETIIGPAFVVRDFFSMGKGSRKHHRFNYVPRHFTDRSGWNPTESELTRHSLNVEDTSAFMKETVTSYDAGFITHGAEEFRLAIGEDDHVSETGRNKRKRGSLVDPDMNLSASPTIEFEGDDYGYF
jgi:Plavaka transposase